MKFSPWLQKIFVILLFIIVLLLGHSIVFGQAGYLSIRDLEQKWEQVDANNAKLKDDNRKIEIQVKNMDRGLEVIEYYARHDYLLSKPGEVVYRFVEP